MTVLIRGMGWFGAITAWALDREGVSFRWCDNDSPYQAWRASTGIVYPAGDDRSQRNLSAWMRWLHLGAHQWLPPGAGTAAYYGFAHRRPPHGGRYKMDDLGWVRVATQLAVAVDPQRIVQEARDWFADARVECSAQVGYGGFDREIVACTPPPVRAGWVWGWSSKVKLIMPEWHSHMTVRLAHGHPLALYGKIGRWGLTYAYPVASEPGWWYAGSSLINEGRPRVRTEEEVSGYRGLWVRDFHRLFPDVTINASRAPVQGWRPKPPRDDPGEVTFTHERATYPALWHSGVRWAPELVEEVVRWADKR
jgi:hypothetical protein